jgi:TorA maturation chaperone TorD
MRYSDRTPVRSNCERPDAVAGLDEVDAARVQEYALLATLLSRAPNQTLLSRIAKLPGDTSPLRATHAALAEAARNADAADVEREYFALFVGLGRGELLPYGSYYLSGFLHDRPLARLRDDLAKLTLERAASQAEPEDHAAILCEVMAGVVSGRFPAAPGSDRLLFEKHLAPWIGRFFADLERAKSAEFYCAVGALGRAFIDIETEAFALPG